MMRRAWEPMLRVRIPARLQTRRSNISMMCRMVKLVKPLVPVMVAAVALGVVGFLCAIFLTVGAALAITGIAGFEPALGLGAGIAMVVACGLLRGPLHYGEQMCNHYLAFRILALGNATARLGKAAHGLPRRS